MWVIRWAVYLRAQVVVSENLDSDQNCTNGSNDVGYSVDADVVHCCLLTLELIAYEVLRTSQLLHDAKR